jgi:hypothetical protein
MARRKREPLYLVERVVWNFIGMREVKVVPTYLARMVSLNPFSTSRSLPVFGRGEGLIPVKGFRDRADADELRDNLDKAAWAGINPFHFGSQVRDWTTFDEGRLRDWLLDQSLDPPAGKKVTPTRWREWYDQQHEALDEFQRRAIRQGLDRVVFFQVTELAE